jgi:hypothetical protein
MANQFRQVLGPAWQHEEARLNVEKARLDAERVALDARAATFNTDNSRGRLATRDADARFHGSPTSSKILDRIAFGGQAANRTGRDVLQGPGIVL